MSPLYWARHQGATLVTTGGLNSTSDPVTFAVDDPTETPDSTPFLLLVDAGGSEELLAVLTKVGATHTATRGFDGTPVAAHPGTPSVENVLTAGAWNALLTDVDVLTTDLLPLATGYSLHAHTGSDGSPGTVRLAAGSVGAPSLTADSDPDTGLWWPTSDPAQANQLEIVVGGVPVVRFHLQADRTIGSMYVAGDGTNDAGKIHDLAYIHDYHKIFGRVVSLFDVDNPGQVNGGHFRSAAQDHPNGYDADIANMTLGGGSDAESCLHIQACGAVANAHEGTDVDALRLTDFQMTTEPYFTNVVGAVRGRYALITAHGGADVDDSDCLVYDGYGHLMVGGTINDATRAAKVTFQHAGGDATVDLLELRHLTDASGGTLSRALSTKWVFRGDGGGGMTDVLAAQVLVSTTEDFTALATQTARWSLLTIQDGTLSTRLTVDGAKVRTIAELQADAGVRIVGTPTATAAQVGLTGTVGTSGAAAVSVTARPGDGSTTGPSSVTGVATWWKIHDGTTPRWVLAFT